MKLVHVDASVLWALRVGNVALIATFVLALIFVVVYAFQPWWQYESGRNVMSFMAAITLVTGLGFFRQLFGTSEWFLWVRVGVFVTVPVIIAWRVWMLVRVQYLERSSLDDEPGPMTRYDDERDPVD